MNNQEQISSQKRISTRYKYQSNIENADRTRNSSQHNKRHVQSNLARFPNFNMASENTGNFVRESHRIKKQSHSSINTRGEYGGDIRKMYYILTFLK
jgi:hypothetical protein